MAGAGNVYFRRLSSYSLVHLPPITKSQKRGCHDNENKDSFHQVVVSPGKEILVGKCFHLIVLGHLVLPDLWKGIVAAVPFVDVVTTMLDTSIPLTHRM